ncbi:MAG: 16S rRNA processing protein RimM [Chthonomonas sp.]|nr:16S rRNA processing protein RimM [Chthonomonas sp.]
MLSLKKAPESTQPENRKMIDVGRIVGAFGLDGHVKVQPTTDFPERFDRGSILYLDGEPRKIQKSHWLKSQVRIKFLSVNRIHEAELLIGKLLQIPADERPELEDDEFYVTELIGLKVVDQDGTEIGTIGDVLQPPAQDVLVVGQTLIPVVNEFVKDIDLENGIVRVHLIPGMRPEEA